MGSHKIDYIIHTIVNISKLRTHQQLIYKNAFVKSFEFVKIAKGRKISTVSVIISWSIP